jgi:bifunctional DNA-binding transcriptional regulator/antitoxin component of YhaV-PrlF toxin-antitoxin module
MVSFTMSIRLKVTRSGQISVPAAVRRRWGASFVTAEDCGDHLVLRPAADEPLDEVFGAFADHAAGQGAVDAIRAAERAAEREAETARR